MPVEDLKDEPMDIDHTEEEDDEIESSYDVYISQGLADKLYQLQMPTIIHKSSSNIGIVPYTHIYLGSLGKIKPNAKQIELNIPIKQQVRTSFR
jgi:hypothetical protein